MGRFDYHAKKYAFIPMRREKGMLEMRLHIDNGPIRLGALPHRRVARQVCRDRDNRVVILTGTGDEFVGRRTRLES